MRQTPSRTFRLLVIPMLLAGAQTIHAQNHLTTLELIDESASDTAGSDYTAHYVTRLHLSPGSVWYGNIVPIDSHRLRIRYELEPTCTTPPPMSLMVHYQLPKVWYRAALYKGNYSYQRGAIDGLRLEFLSSTNGPMDCTYHIYVDAADSQHPTPTPDILIGSVLYQGGEQTGLELSLDVTRKIASFSINLPRHCKDIQILDPGTVTADGVFSPATNINQDKTFFVVADGPVGASHVRFGLSGPTDAPHCRVPVFGTFAPPMP